jgi:chlorophyll synthase
MLLAGPLMTGYTQTLNDYYDREIDAINEPYRPIPSGAISIPQVITQIAVLLVSGILLAFALDIWANHQFPTITTLAVFGSLMAYIYSAPPIKLKTVGWVTTLWELATSPYLGVPVMLYLEN